MGKAKLANLEKSLKKDRGDSVVKMHSNVKVEPR